MTIEKRLRNYFQGSGMNPKERGELMDKICSDPSVFVQPAQPCGPPASEILKKLESVESKLDRIISLMKVGL